MKPDEAEIGITIHFDRGESDPVNVFESMARMIDGFKQLDRILIGSVAPDAEWVMVLEDVESASITSWIKNKISKIDDDALKEFDIRKQIGAYVVKAKYKVLEYLDNRERLEKEANLRQLAEDLTKLGFEIPSNPRLFHKHIDGIDLVQPLNRIQSAKALLGPKDAMTIKSEADEYSVDTSSVEPVEQAETVSVAHRRSGQMPMILLVKKPDYLGNSRWEFRHGASPIFAHVYDQEWLERFRSGEVILQPGSALHCSVDYTYEYDSTGTLLASRHDVVEVRSTMPPPSNENSPALI